MIDQLSIWERSKSLLVFYVFENHEEFKLFRDSLDEVLIDSSIKRLKVIILIRDPKESVLKHSLFAYFCEKDIAVFGNKIKKRSKNDGGEDLDIIRGTQFDLFLCFGCFSTKVLKWLTLINATKKIGINSEENSFFDMNLKSSNGFTDKSVIFTIEMLNKII